MSKTYKLPLARYLNYILEAEVSVGENTVSTVVLLDENSRTQILSRVLKTPVTLPYDFNPILRDMMERAEGTYQYKEEVVKRFGVQVRATDFDLGRPKKFTLSFNGHEVNTLDYTASNKEERLEAAILLLTHSLSKYLKKDKKYAKKADINETGK